MLQNLSHKGRTFIVSQNGLIGILPRIDVIENRKKNPFLDTGTRQNTDIAKLEEQLVQELANPKEVLQSYWPGLYISLLKFYGRTEDATEFMNKCKEFENGEMKHYSMFIHGYLTPWLSEKRARGELVIGK